MRKLWWLLNGVVLGFVAAHFVNQTPGGSRFFGRLNRGIEEFRRAFQNGYHEAEAAADDVFEDATPGAAHTND